MLPDAVPNLRFATAYLPATLGVSGDFYLITNGPRGIAVAVTGDVTGKGLAASQLAWYVRTAIATAAQFTADPAEILRLASPASNPLQRAAASCSTPTASPKHATDNNDPHPCSGNSASPRSSPPSSQPPQT